MKRENIINILSNAKKYICTENIDNCKDCQLRDEIILEDDYIEKDVIKNICETIDVILDELEDTK